MLIQKGVCAKKDQGGTTSPGPRESPSSQLFSFAAPRLYPSDRSSCTFDRMHLSSRPATISISSLLAVWLRSED